MEWSPVFVFEIADGAIIMNVIFFFFSDLVDFIVCRLTAQWCGVGWGPRETPAWSLLPLCPCLHCIPSESLTAATCSRMRK